MPAIQIMRLRSTTIKARVALLFLATLVVSDSVLTDTFRIAGMARSYMCNLFVTTAFMLVE